MRVPLLFTWVSESPEEAEAKDTGGYVCSLLGENENRAS